MSHVDEGMLHAYLDGALDDLPAAEALEDLAETGVGGLGKSGGSSPIVVRSARWARAGHLHPLRLGLLHL